MLPQGVRDFYAGRLASGLPENQALIDVESCGSFIGVPGFPDPYFVNWNGKLDTFSYHVCHNFFGLSKNDCLP